MKLNELSRNTVLSESVFSQIRDWLTDRRNAKVRRVWDNKTDEEILVAYEDASNWLQLSDKVQLPTSLVDSIEARMREYIMPQLERRNLHNY